MYETKCDLDPCLRRLGEAMGIFIDKHIGLLPVVDAQGRPVGVLG